LRASISCSPIAARVRLGYEEPGVRAFRPRSLNAWITLRTVWEVQPKERAICGGRSPLDLTRVFGSGAGRRHRRSAIPRARRRLSARPSLRRRVPPWPRRLRARPFQSILPEAVWEANSGTLEPKKKWLCCLANSSLISTGWFWRTASYSFMGDHLSISIWPQCPGPIVRNLFAI
jgi:hypothetical protein